MGTGVFNTRFMVILHAWSITTGKHTPLFSTKIEQKKLGLSWAKLKFSLVRVDDEVTVIFNSV